MYAENNYQQDACKDVIEAMLDCCELNTVREFPSCDGFKFMLKKRAEARQKSTKKAN